MIGMEYVVYLSTAAFNTNKKARPHSGFPSVSGLAVRLEKAVADREEDEDSKAASVGKKKVAPAADGSSAELSKSAKKRLRKARSAAGSAAVAPAADAPETMPAVAEEPEEEEEEPKGNSAQPSKGKKLRKRVRDRLAKAVREESNLFSRVPWPGC